MPIKYIFLQNKHDEYDSTYSNYQIANCFPISSLLKAINISRVDLFSLDVETAEVEILKVFPFDQILIDVWVIEHFAVIKFPDVPLESLKSSDGSLSVKSLQLNNGDYHEDFDFVQFIESKGFYLFDMFCSTLIDHVFIRIESDLFRQLNVPNDLIKRYRICDSKNVYLQNTPFANPDAQLRDKRHFPDLKFRVK